MILRRAIGSDGSFIVEMARLACVIEDRPLPPPESPDVLGLLPGSGDRALIASNEAGQPIGAAWWFSHEPPLVRDADGRPLPEMAMAVVEEARSHGIGTALIEALAMEASELFPALSLNVHLRNPAARLYTRTGFEVAGKGRGPFGVAMIRKLAVRAQP
jgi:GNAT superfamily N-acetyltransferase